MTPISSPGQENVRETASLPVRPPVSIRELEFEIPMNPCIDSTHTWEVGQELHNSARVGIDVFQVAARVLSAILLLAGILSAQERLNAASDPSAFNIQEQTACEAEMLRATGASESFSGKGSEVLTEVAQAYGRVIPHLYVFPGSLNMIYIAGSAAVDGRGKIVVGQHAIEQFDAFSLKGFLGHEMAHLVSDSGAQRCNDYILRDPKMEADADALAARTLGTGPVKAFLQRVLALTQGQNWEAKYRLEVLQSKVYLGSDGKPQKPSFDRH